MLPLQPGARQNYIFEIVGIINRETLPATDEAGARAKSESRILSASKFRATRNSRDYATYLAASSRR
jgi:hypothetical protein